MITDYHAKLYANELTRRFPSDSVEKFTGTLMDSQVDLNPHQVDAALFAFRSPLSTGAVLADEVGLGKTIEAGIVLSQKWAEGKKKILIILPSNLRKQWNQELWEKFYLPSIILEAKSFNKSIKTGSINPFVNDSIVICSYHFARNKSEYIQTTPWDLVVIDEAHRLRNVYKTTNKIAREIKQALFGVPKLLLTATPLQNSLMELYGLVSFIDEHRFGDIKSFRKQYARLSSDDNFNELKSRLQPVCKRTLRRQVLEYIRYTERKPHTQSFVPSDDEMALYDMVSDYLRRPNLQALPASQRSLMILVLRKLLASSTFAIAGALDTLATKLEKQLSDDDAYNEALENLSDDFESLDELVDESDSETDIEYIPLSEMDRELIQEEVDELRSFYDLAMRITHNAKGEALLQALNVGFKMTQDLGGMEKGIIFTESRRTQQYLIQLLEQNGYKDEIVLFNGTNNDQHSRELYQNWKEQYKDTDRITGSRTVDMRSALVDYFKSSAKIMIATEAAAEGINLQFCSLVVNYDLPWNPQRIEQRIGRCHRYGQKHDVVVVNFLNQRNAADQRVFELLSEKFRLFEGVFGSSDEVLGSIESGVDFEKRIAEIYQTCRTPEEIKTVFDSLQQELSEEIAGEMLNTRQKLLENFDIEVAEKLKVYKAEATVSLSKFENLLWDLTHYSLSSYATFDNEQLTFSLNHSPIESIPIGSYSLRKGEDSNHHYRLQHPLARYILGNAAKRNLSAVKVVFNYSNHSGNIAILEELIGQNGILMYSKLSVETFESEDHIIGSALTEEGKVLTTDQARRLFELPAEIMDASAFEFNSLNQVFEGNKAEVLSKISERNANFFDEEMEKLNQWAEDQKHSLDLQIRDLDMEIRLTKAEARKKPTLEEKVSLQRHVKTLEKKRSEIRKRFFEIQDEIDQRKDDLLDEIEERMQQTIKEEELFCIQWSLI